jgi:hypothetical protein
MQSFEPTRETHITATKRLPKPLNRFNSNTRRQIDGHHQPHNHPQQASSRRSVLPAADAQPTTLFFRGLAAASKTAIRTSKEQSKFGSS